MTEPLPYSDLDSFSQWFRSQTSTLYKKLDLIIDETCSNYTTTRSKGISFLCENISKSFQVHFITFHVLMYTADKRVEYTIEVNFSVFRLPEEVAFCHILGPYDNADALLESFLQLFWTMRECSECLARLCPEDHRLCSDCVHHKIREEFGVRMGHKDGHEKCTICLEEVYNNRLQCGHYFHKACLIQLYPYLWYKIVDEDDYEDELVRKALCCPVCRSSLTMTDKQTFFALNMLDT